MNSPEIDHLGIHDLHGVIKSLGGRPNANGFVITSIEKTVAGVTTKYDRVYSAYGELRATGPGGSLLGFQTVGMLIRVTDGAAKYVITVAARGRNVDLWAHVSGGEDWPQYDLRWDVERGPGQKMEWKGVCKKPPSQDSVDLLGMNQFHSVVFEDDEIDAKKKVVRGKHAEKYWFNIGCAGHAVAKMLLTGNTSAADNKFGFHSTFDDKTTAIKMIVGDYCGKGFPFTVAGQPLNWTDKNNWNKYPIGFAGEKEAEWTSAGAVCLNKPRVLANPVPAGTATFPTLMDDIKAECGYVIPYCGSPGPGDNDPYNMNGAFFLSANP